MLQLVFYDGSVLALSPQQTLTLGRGWPTSWQHPYISREHIKLQLTTSPVDQIYGSRSGGDGVGNGAAEAEAGGSGTARELGLRMQAYRTSGVRSGDGNDTYLGAVVEIRATGQNRECGLLVEQQQTPGGLFQRGWRGASSYLLLACLACTRRPSPMPPPILLQHLIASLSPLLHALHRGFRSPLPFPCAQSATKH